MGCEETELCIRLRRLRPDAELLYEPRARVRHMVTLERARTRYFVTRCWSEGVSKALVAHQAGARQGLASERTHALRTLPRGVARELGTLLSLRDAAGALRAAGIAVGLTVTAAGYARGTLRRRPTPPSSAPSADRASAVNDLPEGARGAPPSLADLTVVVPVRDAEGLVDDCLAPIAAGSPAEVIVVDGASTDATVERARAHGARVLSDEGRGLPVARMLGAREARTAYVALVDVDVTMPPDALSALLEEVHAGGYGALQAGLLSTGGPGYWGRALAHHHRTGRSRGWFGVVATVFRRDVLLEHGFDDAFLSGEDIDLRWRLRRAGVRIGVSERTFVEHRFGDGFVFARGQWMADGHGLGRMILGHGLSAKLLLGLPLAGGIRGILLSLWRREPQWIPYYLCFTAFNYVAMGRELRSRLRSRPR